MVDDRVSTICKRYDDRTRKSLSSLATRLSCSNLSEASAAGKYPPSPCARPLSGEPLRLTPRELRALPLARAA